MFSVLWCKDKVFLDMMGWIVRKMCKKNEEAACDLLVFSFIAWCRCG